MLLSSQGTNVKIIWKGLLLSLWYDVSCTAKEPTGSVAVYGQGNTSLIDLGVWCILYCLFLIFDVLLMFVTDFDVMVNKEMVNNCI